MDPWASTSTWVDEKDPALAFSLATSTLPIAASLDNSAFPTPTLGPSGWGDEGIGSAALDWGRRQDDTGIGEDWGVATGSGAFESGVDTTGSHSVEHSPEARRPEGGIDWEPHHDSGPNQTSAVDGVLDPPAVELDLPPLASASSVNINFATSFTTGSVPAKDEERNSLESNADANLRDDEVDWGDFGSASLPPLATTLSSIAPPPEEEDKTTSWNPEEEVPWNSGNSPVESSLRAAWGATHVIGAAATRESGEGDPNVVEEVWAAESAKRPVKATYRVSEDVINELQVRARKWATEAFPVNEEDYMPPGKASMVLDLTSAMAGDGELASLSALMGLAPLPETEGTRLSLLFRDYATAKAFREALDRTAAHAAQTLHQPHIGVAVPTSKSAVARSTGWRSSWFGKSAGPAGTSSTDEAKHGGGVWDGASPLEIPTHPHDSEADGQPAAGTPVPAGPGFLGGLWSKRIGNAGAGLPTTNMPASLLTRKTAETVSGSAPSPTTPVNDRPLSGPGTPRASTMGTRPSISSEPPRTAGTPESTIVPIAQSNAVESPAGGSRMSRLLGRFSRASVSSQTSSASSAARPSTEMSDKDAAFLDAFEEVPQQRDTSLDVEAKSLDAFVDLTSKEEDDKPLAEVARVRSWGKRNQPPAKTGLANGHRPSADDDFFSILSATPAPSSSGVEAAKASSSSVLSAKPIAASSSDAFAGLDSLSPVRSFAAPVKPPTRPASFAAPSVLRPIPGLSNVNGSASGAFAPGTRPASRALSPPPPAPSAFQLGTGSLGSIPLPRGARAAPHGTGATVPLPIMTAPTAGAASIAPIPPPAPASFTSAQAAGATGLAAFALPPPPLAPTSAIRGSPARFAATDDGFGGFSSAPAPAPAPQQAPAGAGALSKQDLSYFDSLM